MRNRTSSAAGRRVTLIASLLLGAALDTEAVAADPAQGRLLARHWCASCHVVEPGGSAPNGGPPFAEIAREPGITPERLRGWLAAPHPPMPDMSLSRLEVEAIVSYIESLRQ